MALPIPDRTNNSEGLGSPLVVLSVVFKEAPDKQECEAREEQRSLTRRHFLRTCSLKSSDASNSDQDAESRGEDLCLLPLLPVMNLEH